MYDRSRDDEVVLFFFFFGLVHVVVDHSMVR